LEDSTHRELERKVHRQIVDEPLAKLQCRVPDVQESMRHCVRDAHEHVWHCV
jgi:hypothetical protein